MGSYPMPRLWGGRQQGEAEALLTMTPEDHLRAAAASQARASLPDGQRDLEVSGAHERRAQTHLLWAIAATLMDATAPADDTIGG